MASITNSTDNKLAQSVRKIPYLVFLGILSALTLVYLINSFSTFIELLSFDVADPDAFVNVFGLIASCVSMLILLPVTICAAMSTYSGWMMFLFPNSASKKIAKLSYFTGANKAYRLYVYVFSAIGYGFATLFLALVAFVISDVEDFVGSASEIFEALGLSGDASIVETLESEASAMTISMLISFIATIVVCVLVTGAFGAMSKHFKALAGGDKAASYPKIRLFIGAGLFLVIGVYSFANGNVFSGILDLLTGAFFVSAVIFFDSVANGKDYVTTVEPTKEDEATEKVVEEPVASEPIADLEEVTTELEAEEAKEEILPEAEEIPAEEVVAEEQTENEEAEEAPAEEPVAEEVPTEEAPAEEAPAEEAPAEETVEVSEENKEDLTV